MAQKQLKNAEVKKAAEDRAVNENALPTMPCVDVDIKSRILTIRGVQVMLDRDLAELYGVSTKRLNEQVKRNAKRFPSNFMFRLSPDEVSALRSQFATPKRGGARYLPYAFTEHGILMLASVLNSETAISASVRIMTTFVAMRKTLASLAPLLARIEANERRQITDQAKNDANQVRNEERFRMILDAMRDKTFPPQKIFFDGQFYDAFVWLKRYLRMAKKELIVIDPYFDAAVLLQIAQKRDGVVVLVVRCKRGRRLLPEVDVQKFNAQYGNSLTVRESERFHDCYLIIDRKTLVHIGASLNHLGKKCFACTTFDSHNIPEMLAKLPE